MEVARRRALVWGEGGDGHHALGQLLTSQLGHQWVAPAPGARELDLVVDFLRADQQIGVFRTQAEVDDLLHASGLELLQLRRHVRVADVVRLVGEDLEAASRDELVGGLLR